MKNCLKFKHGQFTGSQDFERLLEENDGYFSKDLELMVFDLQGSEISVIYNLSVSGRVLVDSGDYFTPSITECKVTDIYIDIVEAFDDEIDVNLTPDTISMLKLTINKNL